MAGLEDDPDAASSSGRCSVDLRCTDLVLRCAVCGWVRSLPGPLVQDDVDAWSAQHVLVQALQWVVVDAATGRPVARVTRERLPILTMLEPRRRRP